jgi:hypothetical protein
MKGIQLAETLAPDVILVDLRKRDVQRGDLQAHRPRKRHLAHRRLRLTSHRRKKKAARAAGACVCLLKGLSLKDLAGRLVDVASAPVAAATVPGLGLRSA